MTIGEDIFTMITLMTLGADISHIIEVESL